MGLGIRLSMGLREIESFPLHRFKVDFRVVEFIYHRIFEKLSNENFTRTQPELGEQRTSERKSK